MPDVADIQASVLELKNAFSEFRDANDKALDEKASKGSVDPLLTEKIDKLQTAFEDNNKIVEKAGLEQKAAADRIDELETVLARAGSSANDSEAELEAKEQTREMILTDHYDLGRPIDLNVDDVDPIDVKAFKLYNKHYETYLRRGDNAFLTKMGGHQLETKLMSVDRDPGGGYWVRPQMSNRITKVVFETSPVRPYATVETIGSDSLELIADENQAGFGWVAEQESRAETTTPDIGKRVIHAHELYAEPRVTQKLLDDGGFNVERWLSNKVSERFARAESTAFVVGTGVGQPRGFMTYADGTSAGQIEQIASTDANLLTFDGLINLVYSLKSPYLRRARFMAARLTIRDIRLLKDGQGRYQWEPITQVGQPQNILGYPIHQADDVAAVSAGNLALAFGDFAAAYTIVDRKGVRVLRDPYTAKPYIKLYTTRRVGGDVVNFEAIKIQDIAAS